MEKGKCDICGKETMCERRNVQIADKTIEYLICKGCSAIKYCVPIEQN